MSNRLMNVLPLLVMGMWVWVVPAWLSGGTSG